MEIRWVDRVLVEPLVGDPAVGVRTDKDETTLREAVGDPGTGTREHVLDESETRFDTCTLVAVNTRNKGDRLPALGRFDVLGEFSHPDRLRVLLARVAVAVAVPGPDCLDPQTVGMLGGEMLESGHRLLESDEPDTVPRIWKDTRLVVTERPERVRPRRVLELLGRVGSSDCLGLSGRETGVCHRLLGVCSELGIECRERVEPRCIGEPHECRDPVLCLDIANEELVPVCHRRLLDPTARAACQQCADCRGRQRGELPSGPP